MQLAIGFFADGSCWTHAHHAAFSLPLKKTFYWCIRMGIVIVKLFIHGGISRDIHSEITFYGSSNASL